jgi:aconitate hydratase
MVAGVEGGMSTYKGETMPIYDAAMRHKADGTPLVVIAGKEYGTGSSRDWAAKGTALLGVRAVIVESFERIHRSNLVGMGVCRSSSRRREPPTLGLKSDDSFTIRGVADLQPGRSGSSRTRADGTAFTCTALCALIPPTSWNTSATAAFCPT